MMFAVRTTLAIDDDLLEVARELAHQRRMSLGSAFSLLVRRGLAAMAPVHVRNGFAVFDVTGSDARFGPEEVAKAMAGEDADAGRLLAGG
jgi:hypothetical protein